MAVMFLRPLSPVKRTDVVSKGTLELRELILNHRLLDVYYARLRDDNIEEYHRLRQANRVQQAS